MWAGRDASNRIISYYSYLFSFPSRKTMIVTISLMPICVSTLAFTLAWGPGAVGHGLQYGLLGLTIPLIVSDILASIFMGDDMFMTPRRVTILSFASFVIIATAILLSSLVVVLTRLTGLMFRGVVFSIAIIASMRHLATTVFSTRSLLRNLLTALTQPALLFAATVLFIPLFNLWIMFLGILGAVIMMIGVQVLLWVIGRWRDGNLSIKLLPLFRAFLLAWSEELNGPLEDQITTMGEVKDLNIDSLKFVDAAGCRAALVVPYIHPGPFRNVGSSALPQVLADSVKERMGCEAVIAHGVSTHEQDLTSNRDMDKIVKAVTSGKAEVSEVSLASPMIWAERNGAMASCQMFDKVALVTLTMSPKSYDDLPEELGERIMKAAGEIGVTAIVVDSHNSILQEDELTDSDVDDFYHVAVDAIRKVREIPQQFFSVGASNVVPTDWKLNDGMGPLGIMALAICLDDGQTSLYVVIDGNNMRSGLREKTIDALRSRGFNNAEVLTSDTHLVNAIGATKRGYYPIGERTDEQKLLRYVIEAAERARSRLGKCRAIHNRVLVTNLTVLGERGLSLLGDILESAYSLFKRAAIATTTVSLMLTFVVLFLL